MIQQWIRDYNYIKDYYNTVYDYYSKMYKAFPITYYSLDMYKSVWDNTNLMGGSYEKDGIGDLSGVAWRKIVMLPVYGVEQIQPSVSNGEKGQTYYDSLSSTILIPSTYNLSPNEGDVIDLNFGTERDEFDKNIRPLFIVTNVNMANHSTNLQLWSCKVKVASFGRNQLEKQISNYFIYLSSLARILSLDKGLFLLNVENKTSVITERLNNLFDNNTGCYLINREYV